MTKPMLFQCNFLQLLVYAELSHKCTARVQIEDIAINWFRPFRFRVHD